MMNNPIQNRPLKIAVVGLGLIGGSMAIEFRKKGFASHIIGVDKDRLHAHTALKLGLVDEIMDLTSAISHAQLVVLAIPANACLHILPKVLDLVENQMITDVSSTKGKICERVKSHSKRAHFVAAHPMAGTEHSGPWAAIPGLFDGKAVILSDTEDSSPQAVEVVKAMYEMLNMNTIYMSAHNQDVHAAYVSHISHISSFALALTVLEKEKNEKNIFDLASGGFDSTVRLAKSSADMWVPIFDQNAHNVDIVLDAYIKQLQEFKAVIKTRQLDKMSQLINTANHIKKVLKA
jgi:prephenate dehydrogenase